MNKSKKNINDSYSSDEESETNLNTLDDDVNYDDEIDNNDNEDNEENEDTKEDYGEEDNDDYFDDDSDIFSDKMIINNNENLEKEILINKDDRITIPILSKYEKVRLISTRAKIISEGGKPLIKNYYDLNEIEIAELELKNKVIPYKIKRVLPNGKYEIWDPNTELQIINN